MAVDWLAAQAAARIAGTVLDHLSVRARSRLLGSNSELAIRRAYEAAIGTFLSEISDEATDYTDALELFFRNQSVSAELAVLLEPDSLARPDAGNLRTALTASGLDLTTLTGFSLDVAVRRMTDAFIRSAAQDDGLRSILHYRVSVETRLIVEEIQRQTATLSLDELRAVLELEGYRLLAVELDEHGDALVQFQRPERPILVIAGRVQFSASLLALILNRLDREDELGW